MRHCADCKKQVSKYATRCKSCARSWKNNPAYRTGISMQTICSGCGKELKSGCRHTTKMCKMCFLRDPIRRKRVSEKHRSLVLAGKHHLGDGTKTPLNVSVRGMYRMREWVVAVFSRDNYACTGCGIRGKKLTADHIKPFAVILRENNITSVEEAVACSALWDICNGRTLCRPCHKRTDTWGFKTMEIIRKLNQK